MSGSDSSDTIIPEDVLPLPFVVCTLSRTLNAEVNKDMADPRKSERGDMKTAKSVRTLATTLSMGLMKTKTCTTSVEIA